MPKINLPMAKFWLEADGKDVTFRFLDVTDEANQAMHKPNRHVDCSLILIPKLPNHFEIESLEVVGEVAPWHRKLIDYCSDEVYSEAAWIMNDKSVEITGFVNNGNLDDHVKIGQGGYVGYYQIDNHFRNKLAFQISYKSLADYRRLEAPRDNDLSLDGSFELMERYVER